MYLKQVVNWKSVLSLFFKFSSNKRELNLDYLKVYGIYVITCTCKNTQTYTFIQKQTLSHKSSQKHAPIKEREAIHLTLKWISLLLINYLKANEAWWKFWAFLQIQKKRLFTLYFAILHDLMVFQVQIQDCCFRSSVVWILPNRVSLLKPTILQADEMSLLCLEMFRNDMRALWLSDFVFLSLFFLSHSLICPTYLFPSSLKHVSLMKSKTKRGLVLQ